MKRFATIFLAACLIMTVGCAKKVNTLPVGATSAADASIYRVLNDAHAFLSSIHDSVVAGKITLSPSQKVTFNALVDASNAADQLWEACHAGLCSSAQQQDLVNQTNQLNAKLAAAQSQIVVGR